MHKIVAALSAALIFCVSFSVGYAQSGCPLGTCPPTYLPLLEKSSAAPEPTPIPTPSPSNKVVAINTSTFKPYTIFKDVYLVGEVRNETASIVNSVKINAVLRDASGAIVDGGYNYSTIGRLAPGSLSPFRIKFPDPPAWTSYELTVTWDTTEDSPTELQILTSEAYFDSSDKHHVRGVVKNQTDIPHEYAKVFLTMYDGSGNVIGEEDDYINPTTLEPGQEVPFDISVSIWKGQPDRSQVARYTIRAVDD